MANIKKIEEILTISIFEVLEKMFFVFAERSRDDARNYGLQAMIRFDGPCTGDMQLSLTPELAKTMAINMLNLEEQDISDEIIEDCVKESINMICGNFLRKFDPVHRSQLTIPVFGGIACLREGPLSGYQAFKLAFLTETGALEVGLALQNQSPILDKDH